MLPVLDRQTKPCLTIGHKSQRVVVLVVDMGVEDAIYFVDREFRGDGARHAGGEVRNR
jgi:hypothetical protein